MPKKDLNAAFEAMNLTSKKSMVEAATQGFMEHTFEALGDITKVPVKPIPLKSIRKREVNEFSDVDNMELEESIREYGLINPISVCHRRGEDIYIISAGERRFNAYKALNEKFPGKYQEIDCRIYELTSDEELLSRGLPYISPEQEAAIYRDSNLLARQLTEKDVAKQIRIIVDRLDDETYLESLRNSAKKNGLKTYSDPDKTKLIISVLASLNYKGWSREKIRQYLKVREAGRGDLLDEIENGMAVNKAYKQVVEDTHRSRNRKTNKLPALVKNINELVEEAKEKEYSVKELKAIKDCIKKLESIVGELSQF